MNIFIYAEDLAISTSSVPAREMLRELITIRTDDKFSLVFRKGSEKSGWALEYLATLPSDRISTHVLPRSRRESNLRALLGLSPASDNRLPADIYLRFDAGLLGPIAHPLIALVADMSVFDSDQASLAWHGRRLYKRALQTTAAHADKIVAISETTRIALLQRYPASTDRVVVIHNGVAAQWFQEIVPNHSNSSPYWVWYGQMTARKNLPGLLMAYAKVRDEGHPLPRLKLVGKPGYGGATILNDIRELGLVACVDVIEPLPLPELVALVAESHGLVFPSFQEGFGMPIVEAMALGRPVLTSNTTAMPEVSGGHAILVDPSDIQSIADGLASLQDPTLFNVQKIAARRRWASRFTVQAAAAAYSQLIDSVIQK